MCRNSARKSIGHRSNCVSDRRYTLTLVNLAPKIRGFTAESVRLLGVRMPPLPENYAGIHHFRSVSARGEPPRNGNAMMYKHKK